MKTTVANSALLGAVRAATSATTGKGLPILSLLYIQAEDGHLNVWGTNLETFIRAQIEAKVDVGGGFLVAAKLLQEVLDTLPSGDVDLNVKNWHLSLSIASTKFCGRISVGDPIDFPIFSVPEDAEQLSMSVADLGRIAHEVGFAASDDQTRLSLNGTYWHPRYAHLAAVATDGHRLGRLELKDVRCPGAKENSEIGPGWIVPVGALDLVAKYASEADGQIQISISRSGAVFAFGKWMVGAKLVEGPFPNYLQVIPKTSARMATIHREDLLSTVRRVATMSSRSTRQIVLAFAPGRLEIKTRNLDLGAEAADSLPVVYEGEAFEIGFNASYLLEILRLMHSPRVRLKMNQPTQACLIEPDVEDGDATFILMPVRVLD